MENDAYNDQLERHSQCDVTVCRCPYDRSANLLDTLVISCMTDLLASSLSLSCAPRIGPMCMWMDGMKGS